MLFTTLRQVTRTNQLNIACVAIISLGSYAIVPFLGVYTVQQLGLSVIEAGYLVALRYFVQRALSIFGGYISDRYGERLPILLGLSSRAISFMLLAFADDIYTMVLFVLLNGIGSSLFLPAVTKLLYKDSCEAQRIASLKMAAINIGGAVGPVIGLLALTEYFQQFCYANALVYLCLWGFYFKYCDKVKTNTKAFNWQEVLHFARSKNMAEVFLFKFLVCFMYANLEYALPLYFSEVFSPTYVTYLFIVNALLVILFHDVFINYTKQYSASLILVLFPLAYLGFYLMAYLSGLPVLLMFSLGVICFTLAEVSLFSRVEAMCADSSGDYLGIALGVVNIFGALGFGAANMLSGVVLSSFEYSTFLLGACALFCTVNAVMLLCQRRKILCMD
ncbi:MFS transporter [Vibrio hyugaensis]|uniref:MFS transporter n=1 Tax=Vibrio hyugaensis TaxID=1534743 RepID=UPI0005F050F6|nr:MFS transporter [Vibrio hyugaensis]